MPPHPKTGRCLPAGPPAFSFLCVRRAQSLLSSSVRALPHAQSSCHSVPFHPTHAPHVHTPRLTHTLTHTHISHIHSHNSHKISYTQLSHRLTHSQSLTHLSHTQNSQTPNSHTVTRAALTPPTLMVTHTTLTWSHTHNSHAILHTHKESLSHTRTRLSHTQHSYT